MPMDEQLLATMQRQVQEQCAAGIMACQLLNGALAQFGELRAQGRLAGPGTDAQAVEMMHNQLWFASHALLNAAANVSKHFWPPRRKRQDVRDAFPDRGKELRQSLGVEDDSPLNNRNVRNDFEHADEKLEEWWLDSENHNIARRTIGEIGLELSDPPGLITMHELFDPERVAISFLDDVIQLQPIGDALAAIYEKAAELTDPRRAHERALADWEARTRAERESGNEVATDSTPEDPDPPESEPPAAS
jgi:hypothetical protein